MSFFTSDFVSIDRILALLEDGGSGRVTLTLRFFEELNSITPLGLLIGHGVHLSSSTLLGDHSVHNDILEVFYRIGAIGLFLYILMLVLVFRLGCKVSRVQKVHGSVLKASVFIFLIISLASMLIFIPSYVLQFFIFWTLLISLNLSNNKSLLRLSITMFRFLDLNVRLFCFKIVTRLRSGIVSRARKFLIDLWFKLTNRQYRLLVRARRDRDVDESLRILNELKFRYPNSVFWTRHLSVIAADLGLIDLAKELGRDYFQSVISADLDVFIDEVRSFMVPIFRRCQV